MIHYMTTNGIGSAWVAAELEVVDRAGVPWELHAMRSPNHDFFKSDWAQRINGRTRQLYPLSALGVVGSVLLAPSLFGRRFFSALGNALFGKREHLRARLAALAHFFVACHWARQLRKEDVDLIHAQWVHASGTIAMYGAWLLGVPFSFTGHAVDLFRDAVALEDKVRRAEFIVCISSFHRELYRQLGASDDKLHTVRCGIDVGRFEFGEREHDPPRILSIGRLVEKKGFGVLIDACGRLRDRGVAFECEIAGNGPLAEQLQAQVKRLGLEGRVRVTGEKVLQEDLPDWLASGDIFAQPCVWSPDRDVDGTPRTLMEAMASGLPSVATWIAGIPDMIDDGESGLLVEPGDADALAEALERLIEDRELARRLARGGRSKMEREYQIERCVEPLIEQFRQRVGGRRPRPEAVQPRAMTSQEVGT
ncbi:MAG: glycosyltransferase [Phycisphaeraceae bacterium]